MVRSMMNLTTLPLSFWDYALESATRILNMVPTKKVDKTPYELWYGKVPNLSYLKVWGCEALVKRDTPDKLEQRSVKCIFIGYPKETMGYYFYFPPENKIVVARYAEFFEKRLISQEISGRAVDLEEIQEEEDTTPSEITSNIPQEVEGFEPPQPPQEEVILICRSERTRRAPNRLCLNVEVEEHSLGDLGEPANYKAAMLDLESKRWVDAMNAEMQSMIDNMDIVTMINKLAQQNNKTEIRVTSRFSLADIRAIRILISIAAFYDYEIWQMDSNSLKTGILDEDIYMVQPEGFVDPKHPRKDPYCIVKCTRPDVAFSSKINKPFQPNPDLEVECYWMQDTSMIRLPEVLDRICPYVLNGGAVNEELQAKYHCNVSTTEYEYIAALVLSWKLFGLGRYLRHV
ncbi:retrotransposon protein, putative, ty1-copia subclass [Tanacetum coccineum]